MKAYTIRAYTQVVWSAKTRLPMMIHIGNKSVQETYVTKSGQTKNRYIDNPVKPHQVKIIKHRAVQNHDVVYE